jgi:hypothetical protein
MLSHQEFELHHEELLEVYERIQSDAQVQPDYESITLAQNKVRSHLDKSRSSIQTMKELISTDYDQFLETYVPEQFLLAAEEDDVLLEQVNVTLFE